MDHSTTISRTTTRTSICLTTGSAEEGPIDSRRRVDAVVFDLGGALIDWRARYELPGRYDLDPERTVFIDDSPANVDAARRLDIDGIRYSDPGTLRRDLAERGLPVGVDA